MTDIVKLLREFAGPNYPDDICGKKVMADAAEEIESLREALTKIAAQAEKVLPREVALKKRKIAGISLWDNYAKLVTNNAHPKMFAFECIDSIPFTEGQHSLFGYHKMTKRAWNLVARAKLLDVEAFRAASVEEIRLMDNVGISTVCEIARLRASILGQDDIEAV
jgi:hypothetical protein